MVLEDSFEDILDCQKDEQVGPRANQARSVSGSKNEENSEVELPHRNRAVSPALKNGRNTLLLFFSTKYFTSRILYLGPSISNIQVVQCNILDDFFLLVHITFGQGNILFSFKVKFCCIRITPALPL